MLPQAETACMRITPALALSVLLGCGPLLGDTVSYRCVEEGKQTNPEAILLVTIDPLLGDMKAERYAGKTLRSRMTYQIDALNEATIRGRYVLPILGITMVLELDRIKGRVTETIGGQETTYYTSNPLRRRCSKWSKAPTARTLSPSLRTDYRVETHRRWTGASRSGTSTEGPEGGSTTPALRSPPPTSTS